MGLEVKIFNFSEIVFLIYIQSFSPDFFRNFRIFLTGVNHDIGVPDYCTARMRRQIFVVWVLFERQVRCFMEPLFKLFKVKATVLCISRMLEAHTLFSSNTKGDIGRFCKDYIMFSRTVKKNVLELCQKHKNCHLS